MNLIQQLEEARYAAKGKWYVQQDFMDLVEKDVMTTYVHYLTKDINDLLDVVEGGPDTKEAKRYFVKAMNKSLELHDVPYRVLDVDNEGPYANDNRETYWKVMLGGK